MRTLIFAVLLPALFLAGCKEEDTPAAKPGPAVLTDSAIGHYCQMVVLDHPGPKAQIFLAGEDEPLWFDQVRDGLAYLRSPEKTGEIAAFYVSDMAVAPSWEEPGVENWIEAEEAWFVVGSDARGGMGAPEMVPFGSEEAARDFAASRGGEVMRLDDIPAEAALAPVEMDGMDMGGGTMDMGGSTMDTNEGMNMNEGRMQGAGQ